MKFVVNMDLKRANVTTTRTILHVVITKIVEATIFGDNTQAIVMSISTSVSLLPLYLPRYVT